MKFIIPVIILLLLNSCKSIDKLTQFDIPLSQTITIPAIIPIDLPFDIPTPDIMLDIETTYDLDDSGYELNNTNKNLVEEVLLKELELTVIEPVGEDFSLLKSIEIYISAEGESEEKVAWLNSFPESNNTLLETSKANLKRFVLKDKINLRVKTVTDEINTRAYDIKIDAVFMVNAKILAI